MDIARERLVRVTTVVRRIPAVVVQLLLVVADLLFHFVHGGCHGVHHVIRFRMGDKIVLVLRIQEHLGFLGIPLHIDGHLNEAHAIKEMQKLFRLLANLLLGGLIKVAVTDGNLHLHGYVPLSGWMGTGSQSAGPDPKR